MLSTFFLLVLTVSRDGRSAAPLLRCFDRSHFHIFYTSTDLESSTLKRLSFVSSSSSATLRQAWLQFLSASYYLVVTAIGFFLRFLSRLNKCCSLSLSLYVMSSLQPLTITAATWCTHVNISMSLPYWETPK